MNNVTDELTMSHVPIYVSGQHNPYVNIAFERSLLSKHQEACFLWVNDPCVILGRNQSVYAETNLSYAKQHNIYLVRRFTGGGAVYHDRGNMNYSFVFPELRLSLYEDLFMKICQFAGIEAQRSGRNDLLIHDKKFSGAAWMLEDGWILYHGTCMLDVDMMQMEQVLTPSQAKLESKGIKSVKSRVINLREVYRDVDVKIMIHAFETYLQSASQPVLFSEELYEAADLLRNEQWIFGEGPEFQISFDLRDTDGIYRIGCKVRNNTICDVQLFSDAISSKISKKDLHSLIGLKYNKIQIYEYVNKLLNERD